MLRRPGGSSERDTPDPIPNSAVKPLSANGTSSQDAGESVAARSSKHMESKSFQNPIYVAKPFYVLGGPSWPGHTCSLGDAGWSSPVARQAHNLKVAGSNPAPATKLPNLCSSLIDAVSIGVVGNVLTPVGSCRRRPADEPKPLPMPISRPIRPASPSQSVRGPRNRCEARYARRHRARR
jgi:hypothetical protein